jgi:FixJ family two-component response regulator
MDTYSDGSHAPQRVVDDDALVREGVSPPPARGRDAGQSFTSARALLGCPLPDGPACLVLDVRLSEENGLVPQDVLRHADRRLPIIPGPRAHMRHVVQGAGVPTAVSRDGTKGLYR